MSSTTGEQPLGYSVLHFAAALGIAIVAGGIQFLVAGAILSLIISGMAAVDANPSSLVGSALFSILLVGLFGGIPGIVTGALLLSFGWRSATAFVIAGVITSMIVPLLVMAFTPLGMSGWSMLVIAIPSGGVAGYAAHYYLAHFTRVLAK